jgi:hypothetical protein
VSIAQPREAHRPKRGFSTRGPHFGNAVSPVRLENTAQ